MDNEFYKNTKISVINTCCGQENCQSAVLFFVLEGEVTFYEGDKTALLKESDVVVFNRFSTYNWQGSENLLLSRLNLIGSGFEAACDGVHNYIKCDSSLYDQKNYGKLGDILRRMLLDQLYLEKSPIIYKHLEFEYYSLYYNLLEVIVAEFVEKSHIVLDSEAVSSDTKDEERRAKIERYINIHYKENLNLEDLANELFISPNYLSRYFTKTFGMSFSKYLKELRLRHAMEELTYTNKSITLIALDNGFTGSSFFNRAFWEKYGQNPSTIKKAIIQKNHTEDNSPEKAAEVLNRLQNYFDKNQALTGSNKAAEVQTVDVLNPRLFEFNNKTMVNLTSASEILRSDIQEHILICGRYFKFKYGRLWDIFSEDMLIDINSTNFEYNFARLDNVFDALLSSNLKPFILLEPKLKKIHKGPDEGEEKPVVISQINSIRNWNNLLHAFFNHIIGKYGLDELESWIFELSYDGYRLKGIDPLDSYLQLYTSLHNIIHSFSDKIKLGGPGLPSDEYEINEKIITDLTIQDILPDFFSIISFSYESEAGQHIYSIRSVNENYLLDDIKRFKQLLEKLGIKDIPLYITEWNETFVDRNYLNDTCYRGAYIIKNLIEAGDLVPVVGYFSFSDRRSEYYDSGAVLQGGNGLLTKDTIFKPAGCAMEFLNSLGSQVLSRDAHSIITSDARDNIYIAAHNKQKLSYFYYKTPESKIGLNSISKLFDTEEPLTKEFVITNIKNGTYKIYIHRVNEDNGNILGMWKELEFSRDLSRKELQYLQRKCEPQLQFKKVPVTNNQLKLSFSMTPNEILFVEIRKIHRS